MIMRLFRRRVLARHGFTLLEILLAIVILGTVLSTVFASYSSTFRVINDIDAQLDIYEMARTTLDRIVEDLESVYVSETIFESLENDGSTVWHMFEGEENGINGESADTLVFSSRAHIHFGPKNESKGTAKITYYVEEAEETGNLILFRRDYLLLENEAGAKSDTEKSGFPLCEGLASVDFKYYTFDDEEKEEWFLAEEEALPAKVSISLEFINPFDSEHRYKFSTIIGLPISEPGQKNE